MMMRLLALLSVMGLMACSTVSDVSTSLFGEAEPPSAQTETADSGPVLANPPPNSSASDDGSEDGSVALETDASAPQSAEPQPVPAPKLPVETTAIEQVADTDAAPASQSAPAAPRRPELDPSDFSRPVFLSDYQLGIGDRVQLRVFGNNGLNVERDIDAEGIIEVGFIGTVVVAGRTVTEVRDEITQRLNDGFLVDPKVSFDVLQYRPIFILGQVAIPGDYPFKPGMTAREAVAIAGGFTRRADTDEVTVYRKTLSGEQRFEVEPGAYLRPGDIIEISRRFI